jgi:hypothetical protein
LIFAVVPEGPLENELAKRLLRHFQEQGFRVLHLAEGSPTEAINALAPPWPRLVHDGYPRAEYEIAPPPGWDKLVIMGGSRLNKRFWRYLCDDGVLYDGAAFPPTIGISPPCVVVPDNAVVVAAIPVSTFFGYSHLDRFGGVYRFSQMTWFEE